MDLKTIKNLLNLISESDVNEVSIEEGDFKIKIKKQPDTINKGGAAPMYMPQQQVEYQVPQQPANPAPSQAAAPSAQSDSGSAAGANKGATITSPIVGTFYSSPTPDDPPFVKPGDTISKGDVLCIVEAMKIMNEIEAEVSGKIVNVLVDNAQPVEYDQPLFEIEPA